MVEALESTVKKCVKVSESSEYSGRTSVKPKIYSTIYSTFTEMYLERPIDLGSAGASPTVCTWRGVPTIDDF